jgi:hypothetical protein
MNNKTSKNLIALGVMAIFFASSSAALAYVPGVWDPQPRVATNEAGFTIVPMPKDTAPTVQTTSATNNYKASEAAPISTVAITPIKKTSTVATNTNRVNTTSNTGYSNTSGFDQNSQYNNGNYPYNTYDNNGNGITALSLNGSNGFMPDTVVEWILVILLILAMIVIFRRIVRKDEHEVHVVSGH